MCMPDDVIRSDRGAVLLACCATFAKSRSSSLSVGVLLLIFDIFIKRIYLMLFVRAVESLGCTILLLL